MPTVRRDSVIGVIREVVRTAQRHASGAARVPGVPGVMVDLGLLFLVVALYSSAELLGRLFDSDVDVGFVVTAALAFSYVVYRFVRGLAGPHGEDYAGAAHAAIGVAAILGGAAVFFHRRTIAVALVAAVPLAVFFAASLFLGRARRDHPLRQMYVSLGSLLAALFVGWAAASAMSMVMIQALERPAVVPRAASEEPLIAITLSGGGYRAAAAHAGVLWALDEAGLSPGILSTVSGGSIVGTAYSLGWTPLQFRDRLMRRKPYLTSDLLNIFPVIVSLLPPYGTGDTFAFHLASRFFGGATLADVTTRTLLINLTAYETGDRVVYGAAHAGRAWLPGDVWLARAVAASAAFPGAFAPVRLGDEYFMDGGIRENLGVEGLHRYLRDQDAVRARVRLVIVSDMGLGASHVVRQELPCEIPSGNSVSTWDEDPRPQPTALDGALRAFDILYDRAVEPEQRRYLARRPHKGCVFKVERAAIPAVHVRVLSAYGEANFPDVAERRAVTDVMSLSALHELSSRQAAMAFWAGARVMAEHLSEVCAAVGRTPCPSIDPAALKPK